MIVYRRKYSVTSLFSDGESEVVRISTGIVPGAAPTREVDRGHRTPLPIGATQALAQRVPPVGADDKTRKQLDLQRKAVLQSAARSESSRNSGTPISEHRDDNSPSPTPSRATPVSLVSSNSSSRSTVGRSRVNSRSEVSGKSDPENRRSDISGKSDNSDRESSSSKTLRSSPFMYGKSGSNRSISPANSAGYAQLSVRSGGDCSDSSKSKSSNPTIQKEPVPPVRVKNSPQLKDMNQAQENIRKSTQEIRRLGFGRNSYQPPPSQQPVTPNRGTHGRASFDDNSRRSPSVTPRTPNSGRRVVNDQGRSPDSSSGDRSRCEVVERQDRQRQPDAYGSERYEGGERQERRRQSGRSGSRPQGSIPSSPTLVVFTFYLIDPFFYFLNQFFDDVSKQTYVSLTTHTFNIRDYQGFGEIQTSVLTAGRRDCIPTYPYFSQKGGRLKLICWRFNYIIRFEIKTFQLDIKSIEFGSQWHVSLIISVVRLCTKSH